MYQIELLPAAHGDAIWIEYGDRNDPVRIVIDGGPAHTYERGLRARIDRMRRDAGPGKQTIDLFVVSHIDCDHIDGAVIFLQECKALGIQINEIWFNAWKHLAPATPDIFQPLQGEFLGGLVSADADFRARWNTGFNAESVFVPETDALPRIDLPQGARLTLLSPYRSQLDRLRRKWSAALRDFNPGDEAAALERLRQRREYRPPPSTDIFSAETYGADPSPPNGSSIAFILEHAGHSCLFAADAYARVLAGSLKRLARERGVDRIKLDAVKLPHHGSMGNVSEELLSLITCDTWLISTNGAVFKHPDRKTVELIGRCSASPPRILCNYRVETTDEKLQPGAGDPWTIAYPGQGADQAIVGGLRLDLTAAGPVIAPAPARPSAPVTPPAPVQPPAAPTPASPRRSTRKPSRSRKKTARKKTSAKAAKPRGKTPRRAAKAPRRRARTRR